PAFASITILLEKELNFSSGIAELKSPGLRRPRSCDDLAATSIEEFLVDFHSPRREPSAHRIVVETQVCGGHARLTLPPGPRDPFGRRSSDGPCAAARPSGGSWMGSERVRATVVPHHQSGPCRGTRG